MKILPSWQSIVADYRKIVLLAFPVVFSNAVDTVMMMLDRLFLARVVVDGGSEVLLGGAMGGAVISWLVQAPLVGLLLYTNALASQNFGRGNLPRCTQVSAQAMYWALALYPFMLFLAGFTPDILIWMGHDPVMADAEWTYSRILIYGGLFSQLRIPLNSFFIASNRSSLVMRVSFIGLMFNIPMDYWLIFDVPFSLNMGAWGNWNLQPSALGLSTGIAGAAVATLAAQSLTFCLLFVLFLRQRREYRVAESWYLRLDIHSELLRFGLPASLEGSLVSFSFNIFLMLFNAISPLVAAAGTITFSWDLCNFIVLMGIGTATTTLVGQSLGEGNILRAKRYTCLILLGALSFSGFISLWFIFAPDLLSRVFVSEAALEREALLAMSHKMLRLATFYLLADAVGVVMRGALNGAGDTFAVMLISASWHLLLLVGAVVVLRVLHLGAIEVWTFFVVYVLFMNATFALRYLSGRWSRRWASL